MKRAPFLGVALAALAVPEIAAAQFRSGAYVDELGPIESPDASSESPQNFAFELRFGKYIPNVDDEFGGGAGPYREFFGNDYKFFIGGEFDWQALRIPKLGSLGPGFGLGYTKSAGKALVPGTDERAAQGTALRIMPLYAVAVLRVDVLARETPVPLVPYAKGGLGYALWWVKSGGGGAKLEQADGTNVAGKDTSYGYQFALGGMLLLDGLDADAAQEMDADTGVNNSYLFGEWYYADLDGFGGGKMQVGTSTWMIGLALEM